jgi:hypothetical protein
LEAQPGFATVLLRLSAAPPVGVENADGIQQAAAIYLKIFSKRMWTSGVIPAAERVHIATTLIPTAMQVTSDLVNRQLVMCLATFLDTPVAVGTALRGLMANLADLWKQQLYARAKPAIRSLKMVLRVFQNRNWEKVLDEHGMPYVSLSGCVQP